MPRPHYVICDRPPNLRSHSRNCYKLFQKFIRFHFLSFFHRSAHGDDPPPLSHRTPHVRAFVCVRVFVCVHDVVSQKGGIPTNRLIAALTGQRCFLFSFSLAHAPFRPHSRLFPIYSLVSRQCVIVYANLN